MTIPGDGSHGHGRVLYFFGGRQGSRASSQKAEKQKAKRSPSALKKKTPPMAVCNSSFELVINRWGPAGWLSTSSKGLSATTRLKSLGLSTTVQGHSFNHERRQGKFKLLLILLSKELRRVPSNGRSAIFSIATLQFYSSKKTPAEKK